MANSQDAVMADAPFVFKPPEEVIVSDGKVTMPRDPSKHYKQCQGDLTQTEKYTYYVALSGDYILNNCSIKEDGEVQYCYEPVPIADRSVLYNLSVLKTLCITWSAAQRAAKALAKETFELSTEVSTRKRSRDEAMSIRIKPPREWTGKCAGGDIASDLSVWLWEVKDYLQLTNTAEDKQAGVASSLLGGDARTQYLVKRTHAANANPVDFKHTMQFFEDTLKDLYVPVAQQAHLYWRYLREREWLLPHDKHWSIKDQMNKYQEFVNALQAQDIYPSSETLAQVLVTSLPLVCFDALKLTNESLYQSDYARLKSQIELEGAVLQRKYNDYMVALRASAVVSQASPAGSHKRHKPDASAIASNASRKSWGNQGNVAGSGSGAGSASAADTKGACHICQVSGHTVGTCPFVNTNINRYRVGFDPSLQKVVRRDVGMYLTNNQPNQVFERAGGKVNITQEPANAPVAKSSKPQPRRER